MKNIIWENQWAQFMAKDEDGYWWEFKERPSFDPWTKAEIKKYFPVGHCDWKQSIIERHPDHEAKAEGKPMKVEGFLTVDGKFFQTEEEAFEHEKLLTIKDMLEGTSLRLHSGDIVKFIEDNKERLRKVFYE